MKTRLATLACAVLLAALAGAGGCVDNRVSIQVQHLCAPPTDCDFTSGCAQFIGYVTLERGLNATGVRDVYLQVRNNLEDNKDTTVGRLNSNDAHVDEAVVAYEGLVGGETTSGLNNLILAGEVSAVKVPLYLGTAGAGEVLARIRLRGYYENGSRFETGEFPITVRICAGCVGLSCGVGPSCPPNSDGQLPISCPAP